MTSTSNINSNPLSVRSYGRRQSRRKERSASSLSGMFETGSSTSLNDSSSIIMNNNSNNNNSPPSSPHTGHVVQVVSSSSNSSNNNSSSCDKYSTSERQELLEMTRKLRQAKRKLFLKSASQPSDSVERFREILLRISFDESEFGTPNNNTDSIQRTRSSQTSSTNSFIQQE